MEFSFVPSLSQDSQPVCASCILRLLHLGLPQCTEGFLFHSEYKLLHFEDLGFQRNEIYLWKENYFKGARNNLLRGTFIIKI